LLEKLRQAFMTALQVPPNSNFEALARGDTQEWDSVAHMQLVLELEKSLGISLSDDEVLELNSYRSARDIVRRHGLDLG
jgi:acyl carrier protein